MNDQFFLLIPIVLVLLLGAAAAMLFVRRHEAGSQVHVALVVVAGLAFVWLGSGTINSLTNGRGSPGETAPWLSLIAAAAGGAFLRWRLRRPQTLRPDRIVKPARATVDAPPSAAATPAAPASSTTPGALVFISYRREDSTDVTGRIYDRLSAHFGKPGIYKDVDSIPLGVDFRAHLADAVGQCRVLLAVIGKGWPATDMATMQRRLDDPRDFVRIEIEAALQRDIPIIPVLVQGAAMPDPEQLPDSLRPLAYRHAVPVRHDPDFHQDVGRLIRGIELHVDATRAPR